MSFEKTDNFNFNVKSSEFYHRACQLQEKRKIKGLRALFPKILLEKDFKSGLAKKFFGDELEKQNRKEFLKTQSWERYQRWDKGRVIASFWIEQAPQAFKLDSERLIKFFKAFVVVLKVLSVFISIMMPFALFYAPAWVPWGIGLPATLLLGIAQFLINKRTVDQESCYQDKLPCLQKINSKLSFNPYRQLGLWDLGPERKMDKRLKSDRWNPRPTPSARELEQTLGYRSGKKMGCVIDCDRNQQLDVFVAESFSGVNKWHLKGDEVENYRSQAIAKFRRTPTQSLPDIDKPRKVAYAPLESLSSWMLKWDIDKLALSQLLFISPRTVKRDLEIFLRWATAFDRLNNQINERLEQIQKLYGKDVDKNLVQPWNELLKEVKELQKEFEAPIALLKKGVEKKPEEKDNQFFEFKLDINEKLQQAREKEIVLDPKRNCATNEELSEALVQLYQNDVARKLLICIDCAFAFDERLKKEIDLHPDKRMEKIHLEFEGYKNGWISQEQLKQLGKWLLKRENEKYWNTKCFLVPEKARFPKPVMEWLKGKSDLHTETSYSLLFRLRRLSESIQAVEKSFNELKKSLQNQSLNDKGELITGFINTHLVPLGDLYGLSGESSAFKFAVKKRFRSVPAAPFEKPHFSRKLPLKMRQIQELKIDSLLKSQDEKMWRMIMASRVLLCAPIVLMAVSSIFFYLMPNVWLAWGFAIINSALGGGSFLMERALKRMQEEKEDTKLKYLYRDRPGRQIEGLQEVCDKYDLDGTSASRASLKTWNKLLEKRELNLKKLQAEAPNLEQEEFTKRHKKCIKPSNDTIKKQGAEINRKVNSYFEERAIVLDHKVRVWKAKAERRGKESKAYERYQSYLKQKMELTEIRREMVQHAQMLVNNEPKGQFKHLERDQAIALKNAIEMNLNTVREKMIVLKMLLKDLEQKKVRFQTWPNKIEQLAKEVSNAPQDTPLQRMVKNKKAQRLIGLKTLLQNHIEMTYFSEQDVERQIHEMEQGLKDLGEEGGQLLEKLQNVKKKILELENLSKNDDGFEKEIEINEKHELEDESASKERLLKMVSQEKVNLDAVEKCYWELGVKEREELFFSLPVKLRELVGGDLLVAMCSKALLLAKDDKLDINQWLQDKEIIQKFRLLFDPKCKDDRWNMIASGEQLVEVLFKKTEPAKRVSIVRLLEAFESKLNKDKIVEQSALIVKLQQLSRQACGADLLEWAEKIDQLKEKGRGEAWKEQGEKFIEEFKKLDSYFQESLYRMLPDSLQKLFSPFYRKFTGLKLCELAQNFHDAYTSVEKQRPKAFWLLAPRLGVGKGMKYSIENVSQNLQLFLKQWLEDNGNSLCQLYREIDKKYQNRIYAMLPEVIQKIVK